MSSLHKKTSLLCNLVSVHPAWYVIVLLRLIIVILCDPLQYFKEIQILKKKTQYRTGRHQEFLNFWLSTYRRHRTISQDGRIRRPPLGCRDLPNSKPTHYQPS
jgi:hypothetical protein